MMTSVCLCNNTKSLQIIGAKTAVFSRKVTSYCCQTTTVSEFFKIFPVGLITTNFSGKFNGK